MTNGARHGLGVLAGLVSIPVLLGLFAYAGDRFTRWRNLAIASYRMQDSTGVAVALVVILLLLAVIVALLCAPRLSPLASLLPGAALLIVNLVWLFEPRWIFQQLVKSTDPRSAMSFTDLMSSGMLVLAGGVLIASSVAPSRWRGRTAAPLMAGRPGAYGPGMPHPGAPGLSGPGLAGPHASGPGFSGPGASPGPFGQPRGYPPAPQQNPQTPPSAPPPA